MGKDPYSKADCFSSARHPGFTGVKNTPGPGIRSRNKTIRPPGSTWQADVSSSKRHGSGERFFGGSERGRRSPAADYRLDISQFDSPVWFRTDPGNRNRYGHTPAAAHSILVFSMERTDSLAREYWSFAPVRRIRTSPYACSSRS